MNGSKAFAFNLKLGKWCFRIWSGGFEWGNNLGGKVYLFPWEVSMFFAETQADLHGLKFLLRWPPVAHQACFMWEKENGVVTKWRVWCYQCEKEFGRKP